MPENDEMPAELDLASMGAPVQGKYVDAYRRHVRMIQLSDDLADLYPTADSVITALRQHATEHPDAVGAGD